MFRIPHFYRIEMSFEEAREFLTSYGGLLEGLERVQKAWNDHCASPDRYSDDDFFDQWRYEANAFNVVSASMRPLFA